MVLEPFLDKLLRRSATSGRPKKFFLKRDTEVISISDSMRAMHSLIDFIELGKLRLLNVSGE